MRCITAPVIRDTIKCPRYFMHSLPHVSYFAGGGGGGLAHNRDVQLNVETVYGCTAASRPMPLRGTRCTVAIERAAAADDGARCAVRSFALKLPVYSKAKLPLYRIR
jgi:hypothetical protein